MFIQVTVVLSVVALASAGVLSLGHAYAGDGYGHEAVAYAPVAHGYGGHEDTHVDYHVSIGIVRIYTFGILILR